MMQGYELRVAGGVRARSLTGLWALATGLTAVIGCTPETAMETPPSVEVPHTEAARVTVAGTRIIRTLATLRGAPVRAEHAHSAVTIVETRSHADEGVHLRDQRSGVGVVVRVVGAHAVAPETIDGATVYPDAGPDGADLVVVPTINGVEDWVLLAKRPDGASIAYEITLQGVAGLRLVSNVLELLDESGTPRLRARPPYLIDAAGRPHAARFELTDCAADTSAAAPWGRRVRAPGRGACRVNVTWNDAEVIYPAALDPVWEATTGNLVKGRRWHTATSLDAQNSAAPLLLAGGFDGASAVAITELYQPLSRTFGATGALNEARGAHAAVALADGSVLVIGGASGVGGDDTSGQLGSLERYDAATGEFTTLAVTLAPARANLTATLLGNSQVLIVGGQDTLGQPLKATVMFNSGGPSLTAGPVLKFARAGHTTTAIDANRVLVVGGFAAVDANAAKTTEIFNEQAPGAFVDGPLMTFSRAYHTATLLDDGRVLLAGGISKPNDPVGSKIHETAEVYTPNAGLGAIAVLPSKMSIEHAYHAATKLPTGTVVISGGFGTEPGAGMAHDVRADTELFDPLTDTFAPGPLMAAPRLFHTLSSVNATGSIVNGIPLDAEAALAVGGMPAQGSAGPSLASAELLLRPLGEGCAIDIECGSGHCSDSVCCDTSCASECDSCTAALKASAADSGSCGSSKKGLHVGKTLVEGPDLGTQCVDNGVESVVTYYTCDGAGSKTAYFSESCQGNTCDSAGLICLETCDAVTMCLIDSFCNIPPGETSGKCAPKHGVGEACDAAEKCKSGFCVDGVCCNSTCSEICQACNLAGLAGACSHAGTNERQAPVGDRSCKHSTAPGDGACAGFCDVNVSPSNVDCAYPDETTLCGDEKTCACEDGDDCKVGPATQARFACDKKGVCVASGVQDDGTTPYATDCAGHKCGPVTESVHRQCAITCKDDTECLRDFYCNDKVCEPLPADGLCDGEYTLRKPGGIEEDCRPRLCPKGKTICNLGCTRDEDCVEPNGSTHNEIVCSEHGQCEPAPPAPTDLPACSVGAAGRERGGEVPVILGVLFWLAGARLRRRRQSS